MLQVVYDFWCLEGQKMLVSGCLKDCQKWLLAQQFLASQIPKIEVAEETNAA